MDISPRKSSQRAVEPSDEWLKNEGYFRKPLPRDPTCLFRAVSEQIYMTQYYHTKVRKECVEFMRNNDGLLFAENMPVPIETYLKQMSCITEWGGKNEIEAMSRLYKCDFIVFNCHKMIKNNVTNNGFKKLIYLCYTAPHQYESLYEKNFIKTAGYCQSIVYQTLYKNVFNMTDIDDTVQSMLHDRTGNIRHEKFFLKDNISAREQLTTELLNKIDNKGDDSDETSKIVTPFSYRVAKALDPNIYRNTDFDTWHELKREARKNVWIRWNNSELKVGGKCYIQMDYNEINNFDASNNNVKDVLSEKNNTQNSEVTKDNNKKTVENKGFFIGHIQEMSKNEGPVVVFIEGLGEKKTVPYSSLKPLYDQQISRSPMMSSPTFHRKNSFDRTSVMKWKKQWNSNTRKTKDSVRSAIFTNLDRINNNKSNNSDSVCDNKKNISNKNNNWSGNSSVQMDTTQLKNFTSIENYSPKKEYPMDNIVEVRPLSIVLDNSQPLSSPTADSKEDFRKKTSTSVNTKNQTESYDKALINNNNNSITENANIVQVPQQSSQPTSNETLYPPHSNGLPPAMYSGNLNVVYMSSDGNVYTPMPFVGGNVGGPSPAILPPPPPTNIVDRANQAVNLGVQTSIDISGADLPYSDIPTLRYFFNLGVECFHNNQMWSSSSPVTFAPSYIPQSNPIMPLPPSESPSLNENSQPPPNNSSNVPRSNSSQIRRKNEQPPNCNRSNTQSHGNSKGNYTHTRMDTRQDLVKNKNEVFHSSNDSQKSKPSYSNNENHRDYNNTNWELRRNNSQGRFKKNNEGRNRNDRPPQYHQDYQHRSYNNYQDNNNTNKNGNSNFNKSESQAQQKAKPDSRHSPVMNPPPIQTPVPASSPPFHQHMNQPSAAMYASVPYYSNDPENYYPSNANIYPIPYVSHPEGAEGNNPNAFVCSAPENYPQSMSPMYAPITYPPPSLYHPVPGSNPHDNWYTLPGQPHYLPYPQLTQIPVSQPPPSVMNPSTTPSHN